MQTVKNLKFGVLFLALPLLVISCDNQQKQQVAQTPDTSTGYEFVNGYPTEATIRKAYDDADLNRAIQAYKFFYPTVSISTGCVEVFPQENITTNKAAMIMRGTPKQLGFTANSDTPYSFILLDLTNGPIVIELPAGPLIGAINDMNEQWVLDYGLPGPDAGKGGKHLIIPPGYKGDIPKGYYTGTSTTNKILAVVRALPVNGDMDGAISRIKTIKIHSLKNDWSVTDWVDVTDRALDFTALKIENGIKYWEMLHKIIDTEPANEAYRNYYGELATLGIVKGQPFNPDARMKAILERAAQEANAQMRVQSLADRRPERIAWPDRKWEWATLRPENGTFDMPTYRDLTAREKWFYQAMIESPAMFRRQAGQGSLYWLGTRDNSGAFLDGNKTYKLTVPLPVPGKLFWSVTVYDTQTRSEIQTGQNLAALRSLVELKGATGSSIDLYFGPKAPAGKENVWIQTLPDKGWFSYFRIYGPEDGAFNGSWKPGDFEEVK